MELQQIGLRHPVADLIRDIQNNKTGIPRRTFVAEGLYEINMVLETGVDVDALVWSPEAAYSDEAHVRATELAQRARRAYHVSAKTLERLAERPNPDGLMCVAHLPDWQPDDIQLAPDGLILVADAMEIPGNLGTLIRTLDACAADCLVLTSKRTRLTHPKVPPAGLRWWWAVSDTAFRQRGTSTVSPGSGSRCWGPQTHSTSRSPLPCCCTKLGHARAAGDRGEAASEAVDVNDDGFLGGPGDDYHGSLIRRRILLAVRYVWRHEDVVTRSCL